MTLAILSNAAKTRRRRAIGNALAALRADMSQTELGLRLDAPQTTVSRWERGMVDMTMEQALEIEVILGLSPGMLAKAAGYVAPGETDKPENIEQLLRSDPNLDPELRQMAIDSYKSLVRTSQRLHREELTTSIRGKGARRARTA